MPLLEVEARILYKGEEEHLGVEWVGTERLGVNCEQVAYLEPWQPVF